MAKRAATLLRKLMGLLIWAGVCIALLIPLLWFFTDSIQALLMLPYQNAAEALLPVSQTLRLVQNETALFHQLQLAGFAAAFLTMPWLAIQTADWIAPGLSQTSPTVFRRFIGATAILFLLGAAVVYFVILPFALDHTISLNLPVNQSESLLAALPSPANYLAYAIKMILIIGLIFQAPAYFVLMARSGLATPRGMFWLRFLALPALFLLAILALPPVFSAHIQLALPLILIFELSAFMVRQIDRGRCLVSPPPKLQNDPIKQAVQLK